MSAMGGLRSGSFGPQMGLILAGVVVVILGAWFLSSQSNQILRKSPAGLDGLQVWLSSEGVVAQSFSGGWPIQPDSIGAQVLPMYDTQPDQKRKLPETNEEYIFQQDEYDLRSSVVRDKIAAVPSVLVLPKWRSGMRLTGLGHPVLLANPTAIDRAVGRILPRARIRIGFSNRPFTTFPYRAGTGETLEAMLYAAQTFAASACTPVVGSQEAMVLGLCTDSSTSPETRVYVLSDPDLINNHGLRLGDNATIARNFLKDMAGDKRVLIDYSDRNWLVTEDSRGPRRERTWADLKRFFGPPFLTLWLGAGLAMALVIWRSSVRFGAPAPEGRGQSASKQHAIAARSKLMRLSNQDGALIREYAAARMAAVMAHNLGPLSPAMRAGDPAAFLKFARRRWPKLGDDLAAILSAIGQAPARIGPDEAIRLVETFEDVLEKIAHDT